MLYTVGYGAFVGVWCVFLVDSWGGDVPLTGQQAFEEHILLVQGHLMDQGLLNVSLQVPRGESRGDLCSFA